MASKYPSLQVVWEKQKAYNLKVRQRKPMGWEEWMKDYLLGVVTEMDEVLGEINWKAHRKGKNIDRINLARELADITKYLFSAWDWAGYSAQDMLYFVHEKSLEMEAQWRQDFEITYPPGCPIIIFDIDGTLADYRKGFVRWLEKKHQGALPPDRSKSLAMEIDLGLSYPTYVKYKEEFESSGGYAALPLYSDVPEALRELSEWGVHFLAYTARPALSHSRIWNDTWSWLIRSNIETFFSELRIGKEQRIARACELMEQGHRVVIVEDEPDTAIRASAAGITVFMRNQPYNEGVEHTNIIRFDSFPTILISSYLEPK